MIKVGDYVTRRKYGNDIIFKVDNIIGNKVFLKGLDVRLYADSLIDDLILSTVPKKKEKISSIRNLKTEEFFYIPGSILHIDSDEDYLDKCLDYYKSQKLKAYGYKFKESDFQEKVIKLLEKHEPNIIVITGHDAYYKEKKNGSKYKNSKYFINAVKEIRKKYKKTTDLIIISGACQSDYLGLMSNGSTFASSPNHININALDPAIVAAYIALSEQNQPINLEELLNSTKCKKEGIGGLVINGVMLKGYPRKE